MTTTPDRTRGGSPCPIAFVGTGPGDPGLLTLRAAEALAAADVVVLDRSTPRDVVERHCRGDVEVVTTDAAPTSHAAAPAPRTSRRRRASRSAGRNRRRHSAR